jgi:predicted nucleotidyltransferase
MRITQTLIKIAEAFASNPFERHNINEIARLANVSPSTSFRLLKDLEKEKAVISKREANSIFYKLNFKNPFSRKLCELISLDKRSIFMRGNPDIASLVKDLKEKLRIDIKSLVLFGSAAREEEKPRDVDILLIFPNGTELKKEIKEVERNIKEIEKIHTKKISPLYMTKEDFVKNLRKGNPTAVNIVKEGIIIDGEESFWKCVGELSG